MSTAAETQHRTGGEHPAAQSSGSAVRLLRRWWPAAVLPALALAPFSALPLPGLLDGPLGSPGSLQLLATCLLFGALATGYDLLLGRTGLLSFGHALYFAAGSYATNMFLLEAASRSPCPRCSASAAGSRSRWSWGR